MVVLPLAVVRAVHMEIQEEIMIQEVVVIALQLAVQGLLVTQGKQGQMVPMVTIMK